MMPRFPVTVWVECGDETCDDCKQLVVVNWFHHCLMHSYALLQTTTPIVVGESICAKRCPECLAAEAAHKAGGE